MKIVSALLEKLVMKSSITLRAPQLTTRRILKLCFAHDSTSYVTVNGAQGMSYNTVTSVEVEEVTVKLYCS